MYNNFYYQQPPYYNTQQYYDNYINEQKITKFKKTCSAVGFNFSFIFLLNFLMFPLMFFLVPDKSGTGVIQGYDANSFYLFNSVFSFIGFFVFQIIFAKIAKINLNDVLSFDKVPLSKFLPFMIIGYSIFTIANYMSAIISSGISIFEIDSGSIDVASAGNSPLDIIIFFVSFTVVPAIAEEFTFRGIILGSLRKYGDTFAIFTSSLLFGLIHGNLEQIPFAFVGGLSLAYLRVYTNSMFPSMLLHFINNGISVLLSVLISYIDENIVNIGFDIFIILLLIASLISIIYLSRKYKNILSFNVGNELNLSFSEKIKIFFGTPGIILCLISTVLIVLLNVFSVT